MGSRFASALSLVALITAWSACAGPSVVSSSWTADLLEKRSGAVACNAAPAQLGDLPCDVDGNGSLDVLIVFDEAGDGAAYAQWLVNLLGHFDEVGKVTAWSLGGYPQGALANHDVAFYLGTDWGARPAEAFRRDFFENERPFIALGANARSLFSMEPKLFEELYGVSFLSTAENSGTGRQTTYFRDVRYRGRVLPRRGTWSAATGAFANDPYVQVFRILEGAEVDVLADVVHSGHGGAVPYIFRTANLSVVADNPFTYADVRGHYLVFTDVLHDLLGVAHAPSRKAILRVDDVHPMTDPAAITTISEVMKKGEGARPFGLSVVPRYENPLGIDAGGRWQRLTIDEERAAGLREALEAAREAGAEIVQQGWTHQLDQTPNPVNAVSTVDFEFWDAVQRTPVSGDSAAWAGTRAEAGRRALAAVGLEATLFEVPNHRASVVDYLEFAERYEGAWSRVWYQPYAIEMSGSGVSNDFAAVFNGTASAAGGTVLIQGPPLGPQLFPYAIHRDVYGQAVLPDNLGSVTPGPGDSDGEGVLRVRDLLLRARSLQVDRCAVAAFSHHPFLVQSEDLPDGGKAGLTALVEGLESLGYEFVAPSSLLRGARTRWAPTVEAPSPSSSEPPATEQGEQAPRATPIEQTPAPVWKIDEPAALEAPGRPAEAPARTAPPEQPAEAPARTEQPFVSESPAQAASWEPPVQAAPVAEVERVATTQKPASPAREKTNTDPGGFTQWSPSEPVAARPAQDTAAYQADKPLRFDDAPFVRRLVDDSRSSGATFAFWGWSADSRRYAFEVRDEGSRRRSSRLWIMDVATEAPLPGATLEFEATRAGAKGGSAAQQMDAARADHLAKYGVRPGLIGSDAPLQQQFGRTVLPLPDEADLAFDLAVMGDARSDEGVGYRLEIKLIGRDAPPFVIERGDRRYPDVQVFFVERVFIAPDRMHLVVVVGSEGTPGSSRDMIWATNPVTLEEPL